MGKPKKRRKQRKRRHQRRKQKANNASTTGGVTVTAAVQKKSGQIWSSTFTSLMQWHQEQVARICCVQAESTEDEDEQNEEEQVMHSEEEVEDAFEVDADYLSFLEVTIKHQQELKEMRAAAMLESNPAPAET